MLDKFNLPKIEEKILDFWGKNKIFEKSLRFRQKRKKFIFYEGPPSANGYPHIGHAETRAFKDVVLRYKTMRGFFVPRKGGWDTHGLPIEIGVEQELGLKSKKEIEKYGIAEFNKKCKESVWRYKSEWEKFTRRMGFWIDLEHPYITYENNYIETLWWIIKRFWEKKIFYKGYKIVPWCPRCGTALSSHELAQGYKRVKENSIYVKFKLNNAPNTFILVWTTTPWTLPANTGLAIGSDIDYIKIKIKSSGENLILAKARLAVIKDEYEILDEFKGENLIHLSYEPLFKIFEPNINDFKIYLANFVSVEDGTGVVHIAPAFGEDDYQLGQKVGLSTVFGIDLEGKIIVDVPGKGLFVKDADKLIINDLKNKNLLYKIELYEHEYPFCWRCQTPLLYYARSSWFVKMSELRQKLIANNKKIHWVPKHIQEGRFGEWLKEIKDWNFSRERYWGTPIPIWHCEKCNSYECIESIDELTNKAITSGNRYFILRHGEANHTKKDTIAGWSEFKNPTLASKLTEKGKQQIKKSAEQLKKTGGVDLIFSSDLIRTRETAEIVADVLNFDKNKIILDKRLREYNVGIFDGKKIKEHRAYFKNNRLREFTEPAPEGETLNDVKRRMIEFLFELEKKYKNKKIVIISHGDPLWILEAGIKGLENEQILKAYYPKVGELRELNYKALPLNQDFVLDYHKPYIDEIKLRCEKCGGQMNRIPEIADVWFDSGAMPFAQAHFPFDFDKNWQKAFKKLDYPADFIVEAIDQTRGWFYTLLAVATALGYEAPFKNVICLGLVLDDKGQKMSKSKGNVVKPNDIIEKYGSDAMRWYFYNINNAGDEKLFSEKSLLERYRRFIMTIWNSFVFYKTYAPKKINVNQHHNQHKFRSLLDKWILSRLTDTLEKTTLKLEQYDITEASRYLDNFVEDLSNWFIRRSRRRFQKPESKNDFNDAVLVLNRVLMNLSKMIAPFIPFFADYLYKNLAGKKQSVHLEDWPKFKKSNRNQNLEKEMFLVKDLSAKILAIRAINGIKVRQPLSQVKLKIKNKKLKIRKELLELIKDETNIKKIEFTDKIKEGANWKINDYQDIQIALDIEITPELKKEGDIREIIRNIQELRKLANLTPSHKAILSYSGSDYLLKEFEALIKEECLLKHIINKPLNKVLASKEIEIDSKKITLSIGL